MPGYGGGDSGVGAAARAEAELPGRSCSAVSPSGFQLLLSVQGTDLVST